MSVIRSLCLLVLLTCCCIHVSTQGGIGSACKGLEDCKTVENTVCRSEVCACIPGYFADKSSTKCLPGAKYDEECSESNQCSFSLMTECVGKCKCQVNFNFNGHRCVGNKGLGEVCELDSECVATNDPKQDTVWCNNKQCSCKPGFTREDKRCVIGGDCTEDKDCKQLENSYCDIRARDKTHCACKSDYIALANNTKCLLIASSVGSGCEENEQCSSKLGKAVCSNNQCKCADGAFLKEDKTCAIEGQCLTDDDCSQLGNSYCDKMVPKMSQCKCNSGYVLAGNKAKCLPIASSVGSGCEENEQCSVNLGKAVCSDNQCKCADGAFLKEDKTCGAAVKIMLSLACFVLTWFVKLL